MNPAILGVVIAIVIFLILAGKRSGERTEQARQKAAQELAAKVAAEEEEAQVDALPKVAATTYKPKGQKMPKPVFLPTPAASSLDEDPVVPWEPVAVLDDEGVIDWDKTEANAVFLNQATGELIEYGQK